jgi:hypothetical protein
MKKTSKPAPKKSAAKKPAAKKPASKPKRKTAGQGDLAQLVERLAVIADRLAETADRLAQTAPPIAPLLPTVEAPAHTDEHADDLEVPSTIDQQSE